MAELSKTRTQLTDIDKVGGDRQVTGHMADGLATVMEGAGGDVSVTELVVMSQCPLCGAGGGGQEREELIAEKRLHDDKVVSTGRARQQGPRAKRR